MEKSNLILSYVLITAMIQMMAKHTKEIAEEKKRVQKLNAQLQEANLQSNELVNYIMELYQLVHCITDQKDERNLLKLIVESTNKITKSNAFILLKSIDKDCSIFESIGFEDAINTLIESKLIISENTLAKSEKPNEIVIEDKSYLIIAIKNNYNIYSVLGIEWKLKESLSSNKKIDELKLLSRLSTTMIEKFHLEGISSSILINEEQNRIANEIHDCILQKLFSASCGIYSIMKNVGKVSTLKLNNDLNLVRDVINTSMKDLRDKVYGLSWNKYADNRFIEDINMYIDQIEKLNNVKVELQLLGDHEYLTAFIKASLYRIICEAVGNSIRHGKAKKIKVILEMKQDFIALQVIDNGIGFNYEKGNLISTTGIGLQNMYKLTESLQGQLELYSGNGQGTILKIRIPNRVIREEIV